VQLGNLDFLATTDVGRRIPDTAEGDAQGEISEWELREWQERAEEGRLEAGGLGLEPEERSLFFPTPVFRSAEGVKEAFSFVLSFTFCLLSRLFFPLYPQDRPGRMTCYIRSMGCVPCPSSGRAVQPMPHLSPPPSDEIMHK
jgi:hypothetical protein